MNDSDIQRLFSFRNEYRDLRYDLGNIRTLLAALDDPQKRFRSVLIAGTNGKGAVARWISAMSPGCGLFISPHLVRINERISIDNVEISDDDLHRVHADVETVIEDLGTRLLYPPTYFERMTAMAFHYFRGRTDRVAVEVGLGGRLDATNVLVQDVSVITSIGRDHMEHLGPTLAAVASEKAGIIKSIEPVVVGSGVDFEVIRRAAGSRLRTASTVRARLRELGGGYFDVDLETPAGSYRGLVPRLAGRHQVENLKVAVLAAEALYEAGWLVNRATIVAGIRDAEWPGRLESIPGDPTFLLDGAHNVDAVQALRAFVEEYHPGGVHLVFGAMSEKDYVGMLSELSPVVASVTLTRPPNDRARDPFEMLGVVPGAVVESDLASALDRTRRFHDSRPVLVTGSLYLVGETKVLLDRARATVEP
jgi:dihydrofolate synthase/folylpolyglutamate synthase